MTNQKKSSETQQLQDQKSGLPSNNQSSSIPNSQDLKDGDLARYEFNRIKNMLNNISLKQQFASSTHVECKRNPSWCLPNVNCTARGTMRPKAEEAFKRNKFFCGAPVNTVPGPQSVNEDTSLLIPGISALNLDVGDPTQVASTVLSVNKDGTLTVPTAVGGAVVTGSETNSVTITGNAANINATLALVGNVSYQGAPNFNGTETLTVLTTDAGGVNSDSDDIVITVNPVDDAPVNTVPGPQSVNEDTSLLISGISVLDLDVGDPTQVASTVLSVNKGGTLTVPTAVGGAVVTGSETNSVTITGNAADINATLALVGNVSYQGAPNFEGTETLTVLTTDAGGVNSDSDDIVITVNDVID